ncbi:MAG: glycine oxidase ThiO [Dehalococcoidia bacterium]|nr:glycine oxidase ThiO [Dehalococcoidia bacterium]
MAGSYDVIVVGGGAIGCALAYYLSRAGARVTIVEAAHPGAGASSAAAGMLAPLAEADEAGPFQDLGLESLRLFPGLVGELEEATGIRPDFDRCGILRIATTLEGAAALQSTRERTPQAFQFLEAADLRRLEPTLTPQALVGTLSIQEAQVSAPRFTQALAGAASRRGAVLQSGEPVVGLLRRGERVLGVATRQGELRAPQTVMATGAWTGTLLGQLLGQPLPIFPRKGQALALGASRAPLRHIVFAEGGYLTPKADGSLLVGATDEDAGFDTDNTVEGIRGLLGFAHVIAPALAHAPIRQMWAGLRPGSGDGLPLLGPVPGAEGLWVASGHYRNGILLAPITGKLMAEWLLQGRPSIPLEPFSPSRFAAPARP